MFVSLCPWKNGLRPTIWPEYLLPSLLAVVLYENNGIVAPAAEVSSISAIRERAPGSWP